MARDHIVSQGDTVSKLAFENGLFADTIWNHPRNAKLKSERTNPNILLPGDIVHIPDIEQGEVACATGRTHRFRRKGVPARIHVQFSEGESLRANTPYTLEVDGTVVRSGTTDSEGWINDFVVPNAREGTIRIGGDDYVILFGCLDPIDSASGVQGRLRNLGYFNGEIDGGTGDSLVEALTSFQRDHGLEATGRMDDTTRQALLQASRD